MNFEKQCDKLIDDYLLDNCLLSKSKEIKKAIKYGFKHGVLCGLEQSDIIDKDKVLVIKVPNKSFSKSRIKHLDILKKILEKDGITVIFIPKNYNLITDKETQIAVLKETLEKLTNES